MVEFRRTEKGVTSTMGHTLGIKASLEELKTVLGEPQTLELKEGDETNLFGELTIRWVGEMHQQGKRKPMVVQSFELRSFALHEFTSPLVPVEWRLLGETHNEVTNVKRQLMVKVWELRESAVSEAALSDAK